MTSIVDFIRDFLGIGDVKGLIPIVLVLLLMFVAAMFILGGAVKKIAAQLKLSNVVIALVLLVAIPAIMIYITKAFDSVGGW